MANADAQPLEYAKPRRVNRVRAIMALIASAMAVGYVARLCWQKFAPPIQSHLARVDAQNSLAASPAEPMSGGINALCSQAYLSADHIRYVTQAQQMVPLAGSPLYQGWIGVGERRRFLSLAVSATDGDPVSSLTLVVNTLTVGGLFSPIDDTRDAQVLPFLTYRYGYSIQSPALSPTSPYILVLSGTRDDVPFRFELSLGKDDRVTLVETPVEKTQP